jgi:hypothetical protein
MNINKEYATTDITLASVLKEGGYVLDRIRVQGTKGIFYFKDVPDEMLVNYDTGKLLIEPVSFHSAIKTLTTAVKRQVKN